MVPTAVAVVVSALLSAILISAAIVWASRHLAGARTVDREAGVRDRALRLAAMFAPGLAACAGDARALLVWQPLAVVARKAWPQECALLDAAAGGRFPFTNDQLQAAHSRWTADWLAWERTHDGEYKLKAVAAEADLAASGGAPLMRARAEAVEREKLDLYQRRYEEYVRTAKALQALTTS